MLFVSFGILYRMRCVEELSGPYRSRSGLFEFALISLIPFAIGLIIAPFDRERHFVQYYPFRFPGPQQKVYPDQKEMFDWLKGNTPGVSTVVSCPDMDQFSWLSERGRLTVE
jgi:hypothetical protein